MLILYYLLYCFLHLASKYVSDYTQIINSVVANSFPHYKKHTKRPLNKIL